MTDDEQRTLGRLEAKVDVALLLLKRGEQRMDDHSTRLRKLENWRWLVLGGAGVLAYSLGVILR